MPHLHVRALLALLALAAFAAGQSESTRHHWARFRGPHGLGQAQGSGALPSVLTREAGKPGSWRWRAVLGIGHSSPCIHGDCVFVTAAHETTLQTICLDRETGKQKWIRRVQADKVERKHRINSVASPTPTSDGHRVVSYFGSFGLICHNLEGRELWRKDMKSPDNTFGTASSPILHGGRVVLVRDTNSTSTLYLLDAKTGEEIWAVDRQGFPSSWSTPVVWQNGDVEEVLVYGAFKLTAYDLKDGSERWSVPGLADEPATVPFVAGGLVYVTSYNMRTSPEVLGLPSWQEMLKRYDSDKSGSLDKDEAAKNDSILSRNDADGEGDHPLRGFFRWLDADRDGELTEQEWQKIIAWLNSFEHKNAIVAIRPGDDRRDAEIAWQHGRGVPECPTPVYSDGLIYMVKNGGIATCLDARTGEQHYSSRIGARGPRYSSPVVGDGKVYAASAKGLLTVWKTGTKLEVLAQNDFGERIMATPALLDGRIYVRTESYLYCF